MSFLRLNWGGFSLFGVFGVIICGAAIAARPFGLSEIASLCAGFFMLAAAAVVSLLLLRAPLPRLIGGLAGLFSGCLLGCLMDWALALTSSSFPSNLTFIRLAVPLLLCYMGVTVGLAKSSYFLTPILADHRTRIAGKLLDTSVLIDGRVADIVECGFLDGPLVIPRFVLHELQAVADSADSARRARGRRGLDVVQQLQNIPNLKIEVSQLDFPATREVDLKLIEFARLHDAKIVTNDFNLNKLAQVQGVQVLNINELASSLRPVVLPGELMRVFILKEGKEHNQGIAYLEDGTMVVVDNARRLISKNIDIVVTSVLQTTAGKMIFGRYDDRVHAEARPISASASN